MSDEFDNVLKRVIQGAQKQWEDLHLDYPELRASAPDAYQVYATARGLLPEDLTDAQRQEAYILAVVAMNRQEAQ